MGKKILGTTRRRKMARRRGDDCHPRPCLLPNWIIWQITKRRNARAWKFSKEILGNSSSLRMICRMRAIIWLGCMVARKTAINLLGRVVPPARWAVPLACAILSSTINPLRSPYAWDVIYQKIRVPKRRRSATNAKNVCVPPPQKRHSPPKRECRTRSPWPPRRIWRMVPMMSTTMRPRRMPRRNCGRDRLMNGRIRIRRCLI
mmetsp:Transcript_16106/g.34819  ORF Transcript_16106/g.34819 Transcript_16106/m.34819 type:complete len:203 (+) Transcript_16106:1043-1651(+)